MPHKQQKRPSLATKKRHGLHHRQGRHYVKVYWPYLPLIAIIGIGLLFSNFTPSNRRGVLAYATNVSISGLLNATNTQRAGNGKAALSLNSKLNAAAQAKAQDMANRDYWSHNTPDGQEPWVFIQKAGYTYQKAGENLAYGFDSSNSTVAGWMNSPSHRANLLDSAFADVGFGFVNVPDYQNTGEETIVVAMYGGPIKQAAPTSTAGSTKPTAQKTPVASRSPVQANPTPTPVFNGKVAGEDVAVTTLNPVVEPASIAISQIQTLTKGRAPWVGFAVGLFSGAALVYLVIKHGLALRKLALEGEAFILHHPLLDVTLISLVVVASMLSRTSGFIR
jgi:uncharacterized protein YkwD